MSRRALDGNPPISTKHGEPGFGYFSRHCGYDYAVKEWAVKAPESGVITNVKIAPATDGGNIVELRSDNWDHRFLHLKSASVIKGQIVSEGQVLGISGNTGNVGYHLHHDVRKRGTVWTASYSNYVDWESIIKQNPDILMKGGDMPLTQSQLDKLIKAFKGDEPTAGELNNPEYMSNPGKAIDTFFNTWGLELQRRNKDPQSAPINKQTVLDYLQSKLT